MTDTLRSVKSFKKSKKLYFPSKSKFKTHTKKRKKSNKWINLESSFKCVKNNAELIATSSDEAIIEIEASPTNSQQPKDTLQLSPVLKYSKCIPLSPVIGSKATISRTIADNNIIEDVYSSNSDDNSVTLNGIDEFVSQDCLEISAVCVDILDLPQKSYSNLSNKNKKPLDKTGLAYKLELALLKQKAEVSFWMQERKFRNAKEDTNLLSLYLLVKNSYKEFGVNVLECEYVDKDEQCIVMLGAAVKTLIPKDLTINGKIKIFQPYLTKFIKYRDKDTVCYFNVTKLEFKT